MSNYDDFITGFIPALEFISTASASNDASIEFTGIDNSYDEYEIHLLNVIPVTDNVQLEIRTSSDGGSSFDSTIGDYSWGQMYQNDATVIGSKDASDNAIRIATQVGSDANELGVSAIVRIVRPSETTYSLIHGTGRRVDLDGEPGPIAFGGQRSSAAIIDAIQFLFDSGNIESGLFAIYGVNRL